MNLQINRHQIYGLMYSFVSLFKYLNKVFVEPYRKAMKAVTLKIVYEYDIQEPELSEYHIHMIVKGEPKLAPCQVIKVIKGISAREFFKFHLGIKRRYFWGGKLWTQSCFVETIGNPNEETTRRYVQNQLIEQNRQKANVNQLGLY